MYATRRPQSGYFLISRHQDVWVEDIGEEHETTSCGGTGNVEDRV